MSADDVARVFAIEDKVERLKAATDGVAAAQQTINELTRIRRAVIRELHAEGWTFARIGAAAGLSRAHQLRQGLHLLLEHAACLAGPLVLGGPTNLQPY